MERPRKINFPLLMLTSLFLLTQTAFALSLTLSYDDTNKNVQRDQTEEEIYLAIENDDTNTLIQKKIQPLQLYQPFRKWIQQLKILLRQMIQVFLQQI